ncbi:MAG: hypothetical protein HC893_16585 [Chloroflexaceae bacterium]|nr:hypothetical protein [Chloroflexaceae bacterium]
MVNGLTPVETNALWAVLAIGVLTVGYALVLRQLLLRQEQGTEQMQTVAGYFSSGAAAYLSGQVRLILLIALLLAAILGASAWFTPPSREAVARFGADTARLWLVAGRAAAVLLGALSGYLVGQIGVSLTAASIVRTTAAARKGYNPALQVAYRSGAATGLLTVGLGLLGSTLLFLVFGPASADILLSFALGAVVATLVSRVSGGVYATATTMGVDIASKGEQGVAADDPRNAASIATVLSDNADNAGGIATDIFGSFEIALVVSIVLGLVLGDFTAGPSGDGVFDLRFALFPLVVRGIGALASLIGNALVRTDDRQRNAQAAINRGLLLATLLTVPPSPRPTSS